MITHVPADGHLARYKEDSHHNYSSRSISAQGPSDDVTGLQS